MVAVRTRTPARFPKTLGMYSITANGKHPIDTLLQSEVAFSCVPRFTGVPQVATNAGTVSCIGTGTAKNRLRFEGLATPGINVADWDYTATSSFGLNGGTVTSNLGVAVNRTLPTPGAAGSLAANSDVYIDTIRPHVVSLEVCDENGDPVSNQTYTEGEYVYLLMTLSEAVFVNVTRGRPSIGLNNDGTAYYFSGSGTAEHLYRYQVAAGQDIAVLDYDSVNAFVSNQGSFGPNCTDEAFNQIQFTLPVAPGAAGSLADANITINVTGDQAVSEFDWLFNAFTPSAGSMTYAGGVLDYYYTSSPADGLTAIGPDFVVPVDGVMTVGTIGGPTAADNGQITITVHDAGTDATVLTFNEIERYSASTVYEQDVTTEERAIPAGTYYVKYTVTGKHASSTNYYMQVRNVLVAVTSAWEVLADDDFTDTNGTALTAHPDPITEDFYTTSGGPDIQGNAVRFGAGVDSVAFQPTLPVYSNLDQVAEFVIPASGGWNLSVYFNAVDTDTGWFFGHASGGTSTLR